MVREGRSLLSFWLHEGASVCELSRKTLLFESVGEREVGAAFFSID